MGSIDPNGSHCPTERNKTFVFYYLPNLNAFLCISVQYESLLRFAVIYSHASVSHLLCSVFH